MKVYSIFTVEYQPEAFEKHAEKFRLVHLRIFFRWLLTIFYHENPIYQEVLLRNNIHCGGVIPYTLPYKCHDPP